MCLINFNLSNALPNPKSSQWTPSSNIKSRDPRSSKDKEKDNKREL